MQTDTQRGRPNFWFDLSGKKTREPPAAAGAPIAGQAKSSSARNKAKHKHESIREPINFWHYKQTGIRSRPIKLLTHPIEHIERKIIITYLLGFMFKFMAILTGPIIVLTFYLITLPFVLFRRLVWALLNLSFLCDARISTETAQQQPQRPPTTTCEVSVTGHTSSHVSLSVSGGDDNGDDNGGSTKTTIDYNDARKNKQIYWNYCPLNFIESYWFKEKLINNVILIIEDEERKFSIDNLRQHLRKNALVRPEYRKFLSKVVSRGIPFYKSQYWCYLGLQVDDETVEQVAVAAAPPPTEQTSSQKTKSAETNDILREHQITDLKTFGDDEPGNDGGEPSSSDQFSVTSSESDFNLSSSRNHPPKQSNPSQSVYVDLPSPRQAGAGGQKSKPNSENSGVDLRHHVYLDQNLASSSTTCPPEINLAAIRCYAYRLLNTNLNPERPLWELRAIRSTTPSSRVYLIFRCHQSLADGKSLTKMLTEHLTKPPSNNSDISSSETIPPKILLHGAAAPKLSSSSSSSSPPSPTPEVSTTTTVAGSLVDEEAQQQSDNYQHSHHQLQADTELRLLREKESFVARISEANSRLSAIFVGPLTVLLWIIWTFTRRKNNHLNKCLSEDSDCLNADEITMTSEAAKAAAGQVSRSDPRRFYMTQYDLTKFHQIKQMTRSTASDVILCALSGALRDYLRRFNAVSNPPDLNISLTVDMRQPSKQQRRAAAHATHRCNHQSFTSSASSTVSDHHRHHDQDRDQDDAICHTSARGDRRAAATAISPEVNCTMVNVPIPVSVEGTVPRLWDIRGTMEELRTSADPWVMLGLQRLLFEVLPSSWYRAVVNYIAIGNSSMSVSNIQGPQNMVQSWCVDLFQRAMIEARQPPKIYMVPTEGDTQDKNPLPQRTVNLMKFGVEKSSSPCPQRATTLRQTRAAAVGQLELIDGMGRISALYYCMQPPTSNIPISFNCITYHSKLFVTSLSRSLLVEDSKLLTRLFFRQLDQLADTIARRRSMVTIIQSPAVPIEVQPSSPMDLSSSLERSFEMIHEDYEHDEQFDEPGDDQRSETVSFGAKIRSQLIRATHKDDLETDIGSNTAKCQSCLRRVCVCRRRKSLFSLDGGKERTANLMSLLRPTFTTRSRRSLTPPSGSPNEMRSLEELREEDIVEMNEEVSAQLSSAANIQNSQTAKLSTWKTSSGRPERSTLSLDFGAKDLAANEGHRCTSKHRNNTSNNNNYRPTDLRHSDQNFSDNRSRDSSLHNSDQLIVPSHNGRSAGVDDGAAKPMHSRSETDLLPMNCGLEPRDDRKGRRSSTASWLTFGNSRGQKQSRLSKSSAVIKDATSSRNSAANLGSVSPSRDRRGVFESLLVNRRFGGSDVSTVAIAKRRRSAAGGSSQMQRSVILKDEMNADVSLRYHHQLDRPFKVRSRRFSTIVGSSSSAGQRRASLVPFGLIQNNSLPKMFWENPEETHV